MHKSLVLISLLLFLRKFYLKQLEFKLKTFSLTTPINYLFS